MHQLIGIATKCSAMVQSAKKRTRSAVAKQVNVRVEPHLYRALEAVARQERRSIAQTARHLLERGLRQRFGWGIVDDEPSVLDIASVAREGGAFDWLEDEPDLYDESSGEPV